MDGGHVPRARCRLRSGPGRRHSSGRHRSLSSSGTTGTPKVMALGVEQLLAPRQLDRCSITDSSDGDRGFNPLPLWHVNAEVVGLLATLVAGSSLVLDERFHRTGFLEAGQRAATSPGSMRCRRSSRASRPSTRAKSPSRHIRFIRSASAPLAPALFERFEAEVGVPIIQSYGMTEAASQICVSPIDERRKAGRSVVAAGVRGSGARGRLRGRPDRDQGTDRYYVATRVPDTKSASTRTGGCARGPRVLRRRRLPLHRGSRRRRHQSRRREDLSARDRTDTRRRQRRRPRRP